MNRKLNIVLSLAVGLLGGISSHYLWPQTVQAQAQTPAPKEVLAQNFVLVDDKGKPQAVFTIGEATNGRPGLPPQTVVKLLDGNGHEIWSVPGRSLLALSNKK